ncbi:DUF4231 domain-containing protein [Corynebacterium amycolatum]|nr:DUF4231 domain-containing protein [Corynebacterium amycolatum]
MQIIPATSWSTTKIVGELMRLELPGYWKAADSISQRNQCLTLWAARIRNGGLILAAAAAVWASQTASSIPRWLAVVGFTTALIAEVFDYELNPTQKWYQGRALAESCKTLAWRFAVGGSPFPAQMTSKDAEILLTERISEANSEAWSEVAVPIAGATVTEQMRDLRTKKFEERKAAYLEGRIENQQTWYAEKANGCKRKSRRWKAVLIVGEIAALVWSIACAANPGLWNATGLLTTSIGCGSAWVSLKQFENLKTAYSAASHELTLIDSKLRVADENEWAMAVDDAEEAISREHTLWLASRSDSDSIKKMIKR